MAGLMYLASPFSHNSYAVRQFRFLEARRFTIEALRAGHAVFSPIVYGMDMEKEIGTDFKSWTVLNDRMIRSCDEVWCLCIDGWRDSKGMEHEIELAIALDLPVRFYASFGVRYDAGY